MCNLSEALWERAEAHGEARGEARGKQEGSMQMLYELVESGDLPLKTAAKKAGKTEQEFRDAMLLTGHKIPE